MAEWTKEDWDEFKRRTNQRRKEIEDFVNRGLDGPKLVFRRLTDDDEPWSGSKIYLNKDREDKVIRGEMEHDLASIMFDVRMGRSQ